MGDNLYLQSIARHLVETGHRPEVCTLWPDVFRPLGNTIDLSPFRRDRIDRSAHYISRKHVAGTDQFIDCCINVGIREAVDLRLDWMPVNASLVSEIRSPGKSIIIVQLPRAPMGREDGYGTDLLPDCSRIQCAIDLIGDRATIVQIGKGVPLHQFTGIDLDLANKTSVTDVLDVAFACDAVLGYCSFIVPLAESLSKPALFVWSRCGLQSQNEFIRAITPAKILHRASSQFVMDDCTESELTEAVNALCEQIGNSLTV